MTFHTDGKRLSYSKQCLIAVTRALDKNDDYRYTIECEMEESDWTLEQWCYEMWGIPVNCCQIHHERPGHRLRMDEVKRLGAKSGLIRAFKEEEQRQLVDKPLALFARLSDPKKLNVVVHDLNFLRVEWDPAVLHYLRVDGHPVYIERRTTFCKLLASFGWWSKERKHRVVPFGDYGEDLRLSRPEDVLRDAKRVVARWGMRRTYSVAFKNLNDEEFVQCVLEMQMARRLERGNWS